MITRRSLEKGLNAAKRYADIAPSAPHALHMPSHIFTRVGAWEASVATNRRSADVSQAEKEPGGGLHAMDFMVYAYMQLARDHEASLVLQDSRRIMNDIPSNRGWWRFRRGSLWNAACGGERRSLSCVQASFRTLTR